jgi:hypothetical protein
MLYSYYNRPPKKADQGDAVAESLRAALGPCDVYIVCDVYAAFLEFPYEVWCSGSVVRNHPRVLRAIRETPVEGAREWHRDGFILAVDMKARTPPSVHPIEKVDIMLH